MKFARFSLFILLLAAIVFTCLAVARVGQGGVSRGTEGSASTTTSVGMGVTLFSTLPGSSQHAIDVNNDGKLDLIALSTNTQLKSEVVVQLGNGDATFQSPITTQLAHPAAAMIVGDMNGDGLVDVIVQDFNVIYVALGRGNGMFGAEITTPAVGSIQAFTTGDFNSDGKLDLVLCVQSQIAIMLGNGDGTLQSPIVQQGGSSQNIAVAVGDFNRDQKLDLAIVDNIDAAVVVFLGNGDGTVRPGVPYATTSSPLSVIVADFNNDGNLDLAVDEAGHLGSNFSHFLGNGYGTFLPRVDQTSILGGLNMAAADFNGDGKLDVAILTDGRALVQLWLGAGDGSFSQGGDFAQTTQSSTAVTGFAAADFDGDGRIDIAAEDQLGPNYTLLLQGDSIVSPTVLSFGSVKIGQSKSLKTKLSNTGSAAFNITTIKIVGNSTDYHIQTNTCGTSLWVGASCTVTVTFNPHNATIKAAAINIVDGGIVGTQIVTLSGFGEK